MTFPPRWQLAAGVAPRLQYPAPQLLVIVGEMAVTSVHPCHASLDRLPLTDGIAHVGHVQLYLRHAAADHPFGSSGTIVGLMAMHHRSSVGQRAERSLAITAGQRLHGLIGLKLYLRHGLSLHVSVRVSRT